MIIIYAIFSNQPNHMSDNLTNNTVHLQDKTLPKDILSGVASLLSQNETQEMTTSSTQGP